MAGLHNALSVSQLEALAASDEDALVFSEFRVFIAGNLVAVAVFQDRSGGTSGS